MSKNARRNYCRERIEAMTKERWQEFLNCEGSVIREVGLPPIYYESESHWDDFVAHGCLHQHAGNPNAFALENLSREQQERLHEFILNDYLHSEGLYHSETYKRLRDILGTVRKRFDDYAQYWRVASAELLGRSSEFQSKWWNTLLWPKCKSLTDRYFDDSAQAEFAVSLDAFFSSIGIDYRLTHESYREFLQILEEKGNDSGCSEQRVSYWKSVRNRMNNVLEKNAGVRAFERRDDSQGA